MRNQLSTLVLIVFSALCLGCEASPELLTSNITYSRSHATFFGCLLLFSALMWKWSKRTALYPLILLGIFALHPAWWQGVSSGDCGFGKADNSFSLSVLGVLLVLTQLLHLSPSKVRWTLVTLLSVAVLFPLLVLAVRPDPVPPVEEVALLDAAAAGNLPKVKQLISQGVPVDVRRRSNAVTRWEPLHNVWTKLRFPDYPFQQGYTPLMLACICGERSTVVFLLEHGADVNVTESDGGKSAVGFAQEYGHQNLVPLLVQHGATK